MRGHLYCSSRCARNAGRDDLKMRVRESLGRPVSARLAVVIVLLACSAPAVLALRTVAELDRLNSSSSLPPRRAPLARIERIAPGADGARIEGTAPSGAAVFLFADGRFVATGVAADGRFRFEGVKAGGPYRVGALPLAAAEGPATATNWRAGTSIETSVSTSTGRPPLSSRMPRPRTLIMM